MKYIAESSKGKISIVELPDYFRSEKTLRDLQFRRSSIFRKNVVGFDSYEEAEVARKYME